MYTLVISALRANAIGAMPTTVLPSIVPGMTSDVSAPKYPVIVAPLSSLVNENPSTRPPLTMARVRDALTGVPPKFWSATFTVTSYCGFVAKLRLVPALR